MKSRGRPKGVLLNQPMQGTRGKQTVRSPLSVRKEFPCLKEIQWRDLRPEKQLRRNHCRAAESSIKPLSNPWSRLTSGWRRGHVKVEFPGIPPNCLWRGSARGGPAPALLLHFALASARLSGTRRMAEGREHVQGFPEGVFSQRFALFYPSRSQGSRWGS